MGTIRKPAKIKKTLQQNLEAKKPLVFCEREYSLTDKGRSIEPILDLSCAWGTLYAEDCNPAPTAAKQVFTLRCKKTDSFAPTLPAG